MTLVTWTSFFTCVTDWDEDSRPVHEIDSEKVMNFGIDFSAWSGHSATLIKDNIFIFGGINEEGKENSDLLKFNLKEQAWTLVESKGIIPRGRSAHAAVANDI